MSGRDRRSHVLIAGAGIGGLTAALALSRVGARITIVERARELSEVGAGLQLSPNATRILRQLDLLDPIAVVASKPTGIRVHSARSGRTLSFMPLNGSEQRWGAPYLVVRRADLQRVLVEAVRADRNISLDLGSTLAGFGTTGQGVRATVKQGLIGRAMEADMLIGADGIRSSVRARLAGEAADPPQETGRTAWRTLVEASVLDGSLPAGETGLWIGPEAHLVHYPIGNGLINVVAITRDAARASGATFDAKTTADFAATPDPTATWAQPGDPAVIAARFRKWHPRARALIAAAPAWTTWPLHDRAPLAAWNAGPIALLGDAAHPTLPFLAQGAAQAIEDAAALADAYAGTRNAAEALDRYSKTRSTRANRVQDASRQLGRIYHMAGPAAAARNAVMRTMGGKRLLARYDWLYLT